MNSTLSFRLRIEVTFFRRSSSLPSSHGSTLQNILDFDQQVWKFGNIFVTAGDGAGLELPPVLGQLRLRRVDAHLVLDVVLTELDTPGEAGLEVLQLRLDVALTPLGRGGTSLYTSL